MILMFRCTVLFILFNTVLLLPAHAQIDTLGLVKIDSAQIPYFLRTNVFFEDINNDSFKEIIVTTFTNIYILNGANYQQIWSSPDVNHPEEITFIDLNNDGFKDILYRDSSRLYIYDTYANSSIWTSSPFNNTLRCYTVGDWQNDGVLDLAIVHNVVPDTITDSTQYLIYLYETQNYTFEDYFSLTLVSRYINANDFELDYPVGIEFGELGTTESPVQVIMLSTYYHFEDFFSGGLTREISGSIRLFNAQSFDPIAVNYMGEILHSGFYIQSDSTLSFYSLGRIDRIYATGYELLGYVKKFTIDSCITIIEYQAPNSGNFSSVWGDFIDDLEGPELCFNFSDPFEQHIYFYWIFGDSLIWSITDYDPGTFAAGDVFKSDEYFDCTQIIRRMTYGPLRFYNSTNGDVSAVTAEDFTGILNITDMNDDGISDIIGIVDDSLQIYNVGLPTVTEHRDIQIPNEIFHLSYPNPFNSSTTIEYSLSRAALVKIDVYDLLGRRIKTLVDEQRQPGTHNITFDASSLSSGIYFYRLQAGNAVETRKMILLK